MLLVASDRTSFAGRMAARIAYSLLLLLPALTTPAVSEDTAGTTGQDLSLSPETAVALEKFRTTGLPGFFAVSSDGRRTGFSFCRTQAACGKDARKQAVTFCERESPAGNCRIIADNRSILWSGKLQMPSQADIALARSGWRAFATKLFWPENASPQLGWTLVAEGAAVGWMKFSPLDRTPACFGSYAAHSEDTGEWRLTCAPGKSAEGGYERDTDGWTSVGRNKKGEQVLLRVRFR